MKSFKFVFIFLHKILVKPLFMKIKNLATLVLIVFLALVPVKAQICCFYNGNVQYPFPNFYTYNHHKFLFTKDQVKFLKHAQKRYKRIKKHIKCFVKYYTKYQDLQKAQQIGFSINTHKLNRFKRKAIRLGQKSIDTCQIISLDLDKFYGLELAKTPPPDSLKYLAKAVKYYLDSVTQQISLLKGQAISLKQPDKYYKLLQACIVNKYKLNAKTLALSAYLGDKIAKNLLIHITNAYKFKNIPAKTQTTQNNNQNNPNNNKQINKQQHISLKPSNNNSFSNRFAQIQHYNFKIDTLAQTLEFSKAQLLKVNQFHSLLKQIRKSEQKIYFLHNSDSINSIATQLIPKYLAAYSTAYNLYIKFIPDSTKKNISNLKHLADSLYKTNNTKNKFLAIDYLAQAVISQEQTLCAIHGLPIGPKLSPIIPVPSYKTKPKPSTKKTSKSHPKTKTFVSSCAPSAWLTFNFKTNKPQILREHGIFYRIYVGTSYELGKYELKKFFYNFQPITYRTFCTKSGFIIANYYVGKYSSYKQALMAANKLKKLYPLNPIVVKFTNGIPIGEKYHIPIIYQHKPNLCHGVPFLNRSSKYLFIQLGTYLKPQSPKSLKHIKKLFCLKKNKVYIYFDGPYLTQTQANYALTLLKQIGYKHAHIIKPYSPAKNTSHYILGVQIGAFTHQLSPSQFRKAFSNVGYPVSVTFAQNKNMFIYYIPVASLKQAQKVKQNCNIPGAFTVVIYPNKVISYAKFKKLNH